MASITSWVRLEPRARDAGLEAGTEARLHDPLWLLARQWQLRELAGVDGGSSVSAHAQIELARLDAVRAPGGTWTPFAPDRTPLDAALAPASDEPRARPPIAARARAGRQLLRLLEHAGAPAAAQALLARFPLAVDPETLALLDPDDRRFLAVMTGRVPDGDLTAATLAPLLAAGDLPASFGIAQPQIALVSRTCRDWLAWRDALVHSQPAATWRPEHHDYRFEVRAANLVLAASHDAGDPVRWYDAVAKPAASASPPPPPPPPPTAPVAAIVAAIPSRVRYRGMPARRYWDLEDGAVRWPSIDAGPGDVGRLLLVEIGLTLADHWLTIPVELPAGSVAHARSLIVTDTFGTATLVPSAAELDPDWRFCELTRSDLTGPLVFVPPAASDPLVGPALEAVDLARDEVSNVLWAIERTRLGADGRPRELRPAAPARHTAAPGSPPQVYRVGPDVPVGYHPYVTRIGATGLELARAAIPGTPPADEPATLPARFSAAAVPARPHQLRQVDMVMRAADGSYHVIRRRLIAAVAPRQGVTLQFDQLVDRRQP